MDIVKKIVGAILLVAAVVIAVHTIVEPLYYASTESNPYSPFWSILDPTMAVAIVVTAVFAFIRKREVDGDGSTAVTREFLAANVVFYGILFIGILLFWSWFNLMSPAFSAIGADAQAIVWIIIDAALPLLLGAMGVHLLRGSRR